MRIGYIIVLQGVNILNLFIVKSLGEREIIDLLFNVTLIGQAFLWEYT